MKKVFASLFLIVLFSIPAFGQELSESQKKVLVFLEKLFAARNSIDAATLIREYALERSRGKKLGMPTREEMKVAIGVLNSHLSLFADQKYGNKDGKSTREEISILDEALKYNSGSLVLRDLTGVYFGL